MSAINGTNGHADSTSASGVPTLTPQQRHYLLKALCMLQMQLEGSELEKLGCLTKYGDPFSTERPKLKRIEKELDIDSEFAKGEFAQGADDPYADEDAARRSERLQEPLIYRQMFHVHLHNFPGLDTAPHKYWQQRIMPFWDEMAARNFSTSIERAEMTKRHFYSLIMTRYFGGFFARGVGVRGPGELRGPGPGDPGTEKWGPGKQWGKGTVKRGLDKPERISPELMEKIDNLFQGEEQRVWKQAGAEAKRVRGDWCAFKESTIETETGIELTMQYLEISLIKNLPPHYRSAEEWARMHAAYIFHMLFVSSPGADSAFKILKVIHLLFPYFGAKQLLMYANAGTVIQIILGILLARPAGAKSLVQRVVSMALNSEISSITKNALKPLHRDINDETLTKRIEAYVNRGSRAEGRAVRDRAEADKQDILVAIFTHAAGTPLPDEKLQHVTRIANAYASSPFLSDINAAYPAESGVGKERKGGQVRPPGQEGADALKFAQLKLYLRECLKKRDREQAINMASGSLIVQIIKDSISQTFGPAIVAIAKKANLSARLGDLQRFIDDLIKTRKNSDNSLQAWIALAARHEQSLYYLFHEVNSIAVPLFTWFQAGSDWMAMGTTDPNHPANRKAPNVEFNVEELLADAKLSPENLQGVLTEVNDLTKYILWQKVRYELELRKNYLLAYPEAAAPSGLSEKDIPAGPMRDEVQDLDGLLRKLMEQEGVAPSTGKIPLSKASRGTETGETPWAWFDHPDLLGQAQSALAAHSNAKELVYEQDSISAPPLVSTEHLRQVLPIFRQRMDEMLPRWTDPSATETLPKHTAVMLKSDKYYNAKTDSVGRRDASSATAGDAQSVKSKKSGFKLFGKKK